MIPQAYLDVVMPLVEKAQGFLAAGEDLAPIAFVGNFETRVLASVMLRTSSEELKDLSCEAIRHSAEDVNADFVFTVLESWMLQANKTNDYQKIIDKYGSIGASPYRVDAAVFTLETRYGIYLATVPLKFKAPSKKKRVFAAPLKFEDLTGNMQGRFSNLLPARDPQLPTSLN